MTQTSNMRKEVRAFQPRRGGCLSIVAILAYGCGIASPAWAQQWTTNGNTINTPYNVEVDSSSFALLLNNAPYSGPTLKLMSPAGHGIGTIDFFTYSTSSPSARWQAQDGGGFTADHIFFSNIYNQPGNLAQRMIIKGSTGYVGIGVSNPAHLLHVAGTIGAEEVIVSSTGADYVFRPDYELKSLGEVKAYIQEHHHLPGVPSEAEVKEKGLGLGEMQAKLLAKIEELTLHMIKADERSARLEEQNRVMREQIAQLQGHGSGR